MPAATREAQDLAAALAALTDDLPAAARLRLEVVRLVPRHCDPERRQSRAGATVLVTAVTNGDAQAVTEALLALQARSTYELAAVGGPGWWTALGRPPQAAFLVTLDVAQALPTREVPLVQHPLEAHPFDRHHPPDATRPTT